MCIQKIKDSVLSTLVQIGFVSVDCQPLACSVPARQKAGCLACRPRFLVLMNTRIPPVFLLLCQEKVLPRSIRHKAFKKVYAQAPVACCVHVRSGV